MESTALLDEKLAAESLKLSISTLRNWRSQGAGPPFVKLGARAVRYRVQDLEASTAACQRDTGTPR